MSRPAAEERRAQGRFQIECPVFVSRAGVEAAMEELKGRLLDIGSRGARLIVCEALEVGSEVVIQLELPSPRRGLTRIRFQGTVLRSQSQHEVAVSFPESGTFLRDGLDGLDQSSTRVTDEDE